MSLRERYEYLREEIAAEARACGRAPETIEILAVSKKQSAAAVRDAVLCGVRHIGENYVQEAQAKFEGLNGLPPFAKHFIGHVQTNKAKQIVAAFDVVQGVDRIDAGRALSKAASAVDKTLDVLVQVNVSPAERFGCAPEEASRLADELRELRGLRVIGVMAIGPITGEKGEIRHAFELAAKTFERIGGSVLSIGMSGDWREAVAAGSTMLRIGTALFGPRPNPVTPL